jgi:hypothetical protein
VILGFLLKVNTIKKHKEFHRLENLLFPCQRLAKKSVKNAAKLSHFLVKKFFSFVLNTNTKILENIHEMVKMKKSSLYNGIKNSVLRWLGVKWNAA